MNNKGVGHVSWYNTFHSKRRNHRIIEINQFKRVSLSLEKIRQRGVNYTIGICQASSTLLVGFLHTTQKQAFETPSSLNSRRVVLCQIHTSGIISCVCSWILRTILRNFSTVFYSGAFQEECHWCCCCSSSFTASKRGIGSIY